MDKVLKAEIISVVKTAMQSVNEKWVTAETLCQHVETLTPRFLKDHGQMFNRTRIEWTDKHGVRHPQGWLYPLHEIQEWIASGQIKNLREVDN